jgi:hypothetical protein
MAKIRVIRCVTLLAVLTLGAVFPTASSKAIFQGGRVQVHGQTWVAYGDSIAEGFGASEPSLSFVARVAGELNVDIDNWAVGGSRIAEQLEVIREDAGSATNVLWLVGYNAMRAGTDVDNFATTLLIGGLALLTERHSRVYLGLCLRMTPEGYLLYGPQWNHGSDSAVLMLNQRIRQIATQYPDVVLVEMDRYDPTADVSEDLVHPSDLGHLQIARDFLDKIVRVLQLPVIYVRAEHRYELPQPAAYR